MTKSKKFFGAYFSIQRKEDSLDVELDSLLVSLISRNSFIGNDSSSIRTSSIRKQKFRDAIV